jgi:hypothetical protein
MRTAIGELRLLRPKTWRDALGMLHDDPDLVPLAGCTDLYVAVNFGTLTGGASRFLDLWPLAPLRRISMTNDGLTIGALATYTDIIRSRHVRKALPMLIEAARQIGGPQIQNRGTIGGNVANASPAGDTLPVLAAADAVVILRSAAAERRVPFTKFYTGYRTTVRKAMVPEGWNARGAGDFKDRDGGSSRRSSTHRDRLGGADGGPRTTHRSRARRGLHRRRDEDPRARDHADRRRAVHGRLSPHRHAESAPAVLGRHHPCVT